MRSRLFALLILILLVGLPLLGYWYFYRDQVSSIVFLSPSNSIPYTVHLRGTLGFSFLPISDKIFEYQSTCTSSCIFSPVPPLQYSITITSTWMSTIEDEITVSKKNEYKYPVHLEKNIIFENLGKQSEWNMALVNELIANANTYLSWSFLGVAQIPSGKIYAIRSLKNKNEIGILTADLFNPLFTIPFLTKSAWIDLSQKFLILERSSLDRFLVSLDGSVSIDFPYSWEIKIINYSDNEWKILTSEGLYTYSSFGWEKNIRFWDYIDLSPQYRLGYISASDNEKKSLQNIKESLSLFLLLDRKSTKVRTLEKGREVLWFISYDGWPAYIDPSGDIWKITY